MPLITFISNTTTLNSEAAPAPTTTPSPSPESSPAEIKIHFNPVLRRQMFATCAKNVLVSLNSHRHPSAHECESAGKQSTLQCRGHTHLPPGDLPPKLPRPPPRPPKPPRPPRPPRPPLAPPRPPALTSALNLKAKHLQPSPAHLQHQQHTTGSHENRSGLDLLLSLEQPGSHDMPQYQT